MGVHRISHLVDAELLCLHGSAVGLLAVYVGALLAVLRKALAELHLAEVVVELAVVAGCDAAAQQVDVGQREPPFELAVCREAVGDAFDVAFREAVVYVQIAGEVNDERHYDSACGALCLLCEFGELRLCGEGDDLCHAVHTRGRVNGRS